MLKCYYIIFFVDYWGNRVFEPHSERGGDCVYNGYPVLEGEIFDATPEGLDKAKARALQMVTPGEASDPEATRAWIEYKLVYEVKD